LSEVPLPGHWRYGDLAIVSRTDPLPETCILTGVPTTRRIRCLFHCKVSNFQAGLSPAETILRGLVYYFRDIPKATLRLPVSDVLIRRRWIASSFLALSVLITIATVVGLLVGQQQVNLLPAGPDRKLWNDVLIPAIALAGFAGMMGTALLGSRLLPSLTGTLKPQQITETHVVLSGASPEFLKALPAWPRD